MGKEFILKNFLVWLLPAVVLTAPLGIVSDDTTADEVCCSEYYETDKLLIDCSDRGLSELPSGLNIAARIVYLSNNNLVTFPQELEQFTQLEELSLDRNHLSGQLPGFVQNLQQLSVLNLSNNNFETWTNFGLNSLTHLDISKNKIRSIDESSFVTMRLLTDLNISENGISAISSNLFIETTSLQTLNLARNDFIEFPKLKSFSIRHLDLSNCEILSLSIESLVDMSSLVELSLSLNEINWIPNYITSGTLQVLDLSFNNISTFTDSTFSSLPHLAVLDLRGNEFKDIWSPSLFSSNPFLREVRVKGNRWSCEGFDIKLLLTYEFLTKQPSKVTDLTSLHCFSPGNVTQLTWKDAYLRTWHPEINYNAFSVTAIMIGIIIGVVVTSCVCRSLMNVSGNNSQTATNIGEVQNLNSTESNISTATSVTSQRIPLSEDLPPSYDEALLMPRLDSSFHSLPGILEDVENDDRSHQFRRSRSIGDLIGSRQSGQRRSVRCPTVVI